MSEKIFIRDSKVEVELIDMCFAAVRKETDLERDLVQMFKLLSDETRVRILLLLARERELHVTAMCELLGQSQPSLSHHLTLLRGGGLIEARRDGKHNFYSIRLQNFHRIGGEIVAHIDDAPDVTEERKTPQNVSHIASVGQPRLHQEENTPPRESAPSKEQPTTTQGGASTSDQHAQARKPRAARKKSAPPKNETTRVDVTSQLSTPQDVLVSMFKKAPENEYGNIQLKWKQWIQGNDKNRTYILEKLKSGDTPDSLADSILSIFQRPSTH